jgi:hypothetical protein
MNDKIKEIVKRVYDIENVNLNGFRYRLVESLRYKCDGSQENKKLLEDLIEHLMCLAILKKRENVYKYNTYKKLCFILTHVFEDVGLPGDVKYLFNFDRQNQNTINGIMRQLNNWNNRSSFIPYTWRMCKLRCFQGIGKKSVMNIIYFYNNRTLPDIIVSRSPLYSPTTPSYESNQVRDSRKDILIRQLQSSVEMLSIENRSLRGSEENIECTICLETEGTLVPTTCGHKFHTNCLMEWLSTHDTCPVCRNNLVTT